MKVHFRFTYKIQNATQGVYGYLFKYVRMFDILLRVCPTPSLHAIVNNLCSYLPLC